MVVVALVKRVEPDVGANDENGNAVSEEQPVEQDERSLAPYDDENE